MKILLAASVIVNVLLFGAAVRRGTQGKPMQFARPLRTQSDRSHFFKHRMLSAAAPSTPWGTIESLDPARFIANLQAIGCPEQTIRDILVSRVSRGFHAQLEAAHDAEAREQPWWRGRNYNPELSLLNSALRRERNDLLEQLFGEPANRLISQFLAWPRGPAIGREFLAEDKRKPLREIEERYGRLISESTTYPGDPIDEEERATLAGLNQQKRAEIEALLTPRELEELDMRESPIARYVLSQLPEAQSEADFRLMFQAAREATVGSETQTSANSFAGRYGLSRAPGEPQEDRQEAQRKAIEARARELLGEQRFLQLQQLESARRAAEARREPEAR